MRSKVVTMEEVLAKFEDGQTIMFGDWHGELSAEEIITGILEKGVKDIHAIAVSGGMPDQGVGRLINVNRVKSLATTHIGLNPVARDQMFAGTLDVEFIPQGTFAERIRCGGAGLGGVLTPTGVGTVVAEGKQVIEVNGRRYLLELPLRAQIAIVHAARADTAGNLVYHRCGRNFNPMMAMAADLVIAEAEEVVEVGQLDPDEIMTPGVCVDMVVKERE